MSTSQDRPPQDREASLAGPGAGRSPEADEDFPEPPHLRRLRRLVTLLVAVMIGGVITVAATLVIRLSALDGGGRAPEPVADPIPPQIPAPIAAEALVLPEGARITAIGRSGTEILVATEGPEGEVLRVFDAGTGRAVSATPIRRDESVPDSQ